MKISRNNLRIQRRRRVRAKVSGTDKRPRLNVYKSLKEIYVQIIDDQKEVTLVSLNTKQAKVKNDVQGARKIGELIAKKCLEKKIKEIVFDRAGYKYHGKLKALAEGARGGGLKF